MRLENVWTRLTNPGRRFLYERRTGRWSGSVPVLEGTRASFERLLLFLLDNVIRARYDATGRRFRDGGWKSLRGETGAASVSLETASRTFAGAAFYLAHGHSEDLSSLYAGLIQEAVDPRSPRYWGRGSENQVLVENAMLFGGLLTARGAVWERFSAGQKQNALRYAEASLRRPFYEHNWLCFKLVHLVFLAKEAGADLRAQVLATWSQIQSFHAGEGWYYDGRRRRRVDPYTAWTFHYEALLLSCLAGDTYPEIRDVACSRFMLFKKSYLALFSRGRLPLQWGRSLNYRFGILAPLGPAAALGLLDEGELAFAREACVSSINRFFELGVLDAEGLLSSGYVAPQPSVVERYSGAGSPYWALKAFSVLLLPGDHAFWKAPSTGFSPPADVTVAPVAFHVRRSENGSAFLLNGGLHSRKYADRYNRFAFSNVFPQTADALYLDHAFGFASGARRDELRRAGSPRPGVLHIEWGVSRAKISACSTLAALGPGYLLVTRFSSANARDYHYCGFPLPGAAPVETPPPPGAALVLRGEGLFSSLAVLEGAGVCSSVKLEARRMADRLSPCRVPFVQGRLPAGDSVLALFAAAGEDPLRQDLQARISAAGIEAAWGTEKLCLRAAGPFYE